MEFSFVHVSTWHGHRLSLLVHTISQCWLLWKRKLRSSSWCRRSPPLFVSRSPAFTRPLSLPLDSTFARAVRFGCGFINIFIIRFVENISFTLFRMQDRFPVACLVLPRISVCLPSRNLYVKRTATFTCACATLARRYPTMVRAREICDRIFFEAKRKHSAEDTVSHIATSNFKREREIHEKKKKKKLT